MAGHFHTPTRMLVGRVRCWIGGSTESDNTYAAEMIAAQGTPSQWLLFADPSRGVTAEYEVHLGGGEWDDAPSAPVEKLAESSSTVVTITGTSPTRVERRIRKINAPTRALRNVRSARRR